MIKKAAAGAVVSILLVLLAGCVATPGSSPHSTPASVTPHPTATTASSPSFALGIGCADILTTAEVQAQVAATVGVKVDEHSAPTDADDVALDQAGGLRCVWGGTNRTDGGYDDGLNLALLPHAAADYATWIADAVPASQDCQVESLRCSRDLLVGDVWVEAEYTDSDRQGATQASIEAAFGTLLDEARARLAPVSTRHAAWTPPTDVLPSLASCADAVGKAAGILGVDPASVTTRDDPPYRDLPEIAAERVKMSSCSWASQDRQLDWVVVPGGGWSFGAMSVTPPQPTLIERLRPATVAGAQAALIGCGDACVAYLEVRGSFVDVGMDSGKDDAAVVDIATRSVAAFR
ncbi:MAG TPA: hypothetical protein VN759_06625 [Pseudolysinimonas sp.]|nr:hypothetical protein [Pseudolysinimonas sp.]